MECARALKAITARAGTFGLKPAILENKVAYVDMNDCPAQLDILAHVDVVPAGDGWTGISGNNLASVLLYFDEDTQQMMPADQISTEKLYTASLRNVPSLVSQDLDSDGIVEIPTQPDEAGLLNMSQSRRMDFIVWMDYTSPNPEKSFGLLDEETNCYIELPMEWEGNLKLTDSEQYDGAVELRTVDEDELVMTLRLVRTTSSLKGWTRLGIVASRQMQAKLAPDVEIGDKNYRLSKALHLLN